MGAAGIALASLEVAVRGGGAAFARLKAVGIHRQAHGAARLAPFEAGLDKDFVEPLLLGLLFHQAGAGNHQRLFHRRGHLAAFGYGCGLTQVLDARVGAGTDEYHIHRDIGDRHPGIQPHVLQRAAHAVGLHRIAFGGRVWHGGVDRDDHLRRGAPGHLRFDFCRIQMHLGVELRIGIALQVAPGLDRTLPHLALGGEGTALEILDGLLIHRHHAGTGAGLDGHVADGHASFDGEVANRLTTEFDSIAGTAGSADLADDRQHDILGCDAGADLAVHRHQHVLHLLLHQALGGQHVLDFRSADTVRQRAEGAVGGGVRVTTDHGHAGQGRALLGADHVDDALTHVIHRKVGQAELPDVGIQGGDLGAGDGVGNALDSAALAGGRHVVVGGGDNRIGAPRLATGQAQPFEGLRRGHFMH